MVILLQVLPGLAQPRILLLLSYGAMLWVMGMLVSWCSAACNNPVFADIVPEHLRRSAMSCLIPKWCISYPIKVAT